MTDAFAAAFAIVVDVEGGLSLNASDPGNWTGGVVGKGELRGTKFGISAASYPELQIAALTEADAAAIYERDYWNENRCGELAWPVSLAVFDGEVNSGREGALALQEVLGVAMDSVIGPVTLGAAAKWDPEELACRVMAERAEWYMSLSEFGTFGQGWLKRLFVVMHRAGQVPA